MRRAVTVAIAAGLSAIPAPARAGEVYMGLAMGPSSAGHAAPWDARFDERGHAACTYVFGAELRGFTIDLTAAGAGYTVVGAPAPADAVLMWFGGDLGRRVWLTPDLALGAAVGLHAALVTKWSEDDMLPDKLRGSGTAWGLGGRLEYVLGRLRPQAPDYHGPLKFASASLVVEARREHMFLTSDDGFHAEPTITVVTAGLRFGMTM